ncbi:MAG: glycosyltransferase family 2 protein [Prevotella sp.]|nr:glycosyltransferase family 2 protein [Prevotella sp.]
MRITILIPIYGVEKYIEECAVSLLSQTYMDIEYVFCDDCTPDKSMEILHEVIEKYPQRKDDVRIIRNEHNRGLGYTRKRLTEALRTDYFMIVDSDDVLPYDAVEKLVYAARKNDTDIVEGGFCYYANGRKGEMVMPYHGSHKTYIKKILCQNIVKAQVWGKLFKGKVLHDVENLFVEGIDFSEDLCAMSRLVAVASISSVADEVYYYRTDNLSSYTKNISEKNILSYLRASRVMYSFYHQRSELPVALEIGLLNAYRECRKSGISTEKADEIIRYIPEHTTTKLLLAMFRNASIPLSVTDMLYRCVRFLVCLK